MDLVNVTEGLKRIDLVNILGNVKMLGPVSLAENLIRIDLVNVMKLERVFVCDLSPVVSISSPPLGQSYIPCTHSLNPRLF